MKILKISYSGGSVVPDAEIEKLQISISWKTLSEKYPAFIDFVRQRSDKMKFSKKALSLLTGFDLELEDQLKKIRNKRLALKGQLFRLPDENPLETSIKTFNDWLAK